MKLSIPIGVSLIANNMMNNITDPLVLNTSSWNFSDLFFDCGGPLKFKFIQGDPVDVLKAPVKFGVTVELATTNTRIVGFIASTNRDIKLVSIRPWNAYNSPA